MKYLLALIRMLSSIGSGWKSETIREGNHSAIQISRKIDNHQKWIFKFTESCKYDFSKTDHVNDQGDWNKLCGISQHVLNNHRVTMMCAYRYNLETDSFELAPYQHDENLFPKTPLNRKFFDVATSVKADQEFEVEIIDHVWNWEISIDGKVAAFVDKTKAKKHYEILFWFGGNQPAPHDMKLKYKRL